MCRLTTTALMATILLVGCADPYGAARTSLRTAKDGLSLGDFAVKNHIKSEEERCSSRVGDEKVKCLESSEKLKKHWPTALAVAIKTIDLALTAIDEAEKKSTQKKCEKLHPDKNSADYKTCMEQNKVDIAKLVKKSVCLMLVALDFLPDSIKSKFSVYLSLGKAFVCLAVSPPGANREEDRPNLIPAPAKPAPKTVPTDFNQIVEAKLQMQRVRSLLIGMQR